MARPLEILDAFVSSYRAIVQAHDGPEADRDFEVGEFDAIEVAGPFDVQISTGEAPERPCSRPGVGARQAQRGAARRPPRHGLRGRWRRERHHRSHDAGASVAPGIRIGGRFDRPGRGRLLRLCKQRLGRSRDQRDRSRNRQAVRGGLGRHPHRQGCSRPRSKPRSWAPATSPSMRSNAPSASSP